MDKLSSFASQAKAKADEGRLKAMAHVDQRFPSSKNSAAQSQSTESGTAAPLPPPSSSSSYRSTPASTTAPPPPGRARAGTGTGSGNGSVFVNITSEDKTAFFSLLDEYFASRPSYAHLLKPQDFSTPVNVNTGQPRVGAGAGAGAGTPPAPPVRKLTTPAPPAPPPRGIGVARALFDFEGQNPTEDLAFTEGQRIVVLEHISEDWARGELDGRQGMFPRSYVEMEQ